MSNLYYIKTNDINDYNNKTIKIGKRKFLNGIDVNDYVLVKFDNTNDMSLWNVREIEGKESNLQVGCNEIYSGLKIKLTNLQSLKIFKISKELLSLAGKPNEHQFFKFETINKNFENIIRDKNIFLNYTNDENNHRKIRVFDSEQLAQDSEYCEDIRLYKDGETFNCIKDPNLYCKSVISTFDPRKFHNGANAGHSSKKALYDKLCGCSTSGEEVKMDQGFYDLFCSAKDGNGGKSSNTSPKSILQPINSTKFDLERCLEENYGKFVQIEESKENIYADNSIVYVYYKGCIKYMGDVVGINTQESVQFDDSKYLKNPTVNTPNERRVLIKIKKYLKDEELTKAKIHQENLKIGIQKAGKINDKTSTHLQNFFDKYGEEFKLKNSSSQNDGYIKANDINKSSAYNKIFYGVPGCGKSYHIEHEVLDNDIFANHNTCRTSNTFRTIFYQDYSHADFVGQYMPKRINGQVEYVFVPKVFTKALERAYQKPEEPVVLIIEEINRGDAASIFGDIFQLLDRNNGGRSEYEIDCDEISDYLATKRITKEKIYIPSNLYLLATMNTCDQNVFALDTAFKRRWNMEEIPNKFKKGHTIKDKRVPYNFDGKYITWETFVEVVNKQIVDSSDEFFGDDRQIGCFFVDDTCLLDNASDPRFKEKCENFAYKVISYLWNDVAKLNRNKWFVDDVNGGVKTLHDAIAKFVDNKDVFSSVLKTELLKDESQSNTSQAETEENESTEE